jgi:hypothetical protein
MKLKLYVYDEHWAGGFTVIANSKEEAAKIIMDNEEIPVEDPIRYKAEILNKLEEHEICAGTVYRFYGDL